MKKLVLGIVATFVLLVGVGLVGVLSAPRRSAPVREVVEAPTPPSAPKWNPTTREVGERAKLIEKLQGQEVFGNIRVANHVGKVVVGPKFYPLDFKTRQSFASVAMAWCMDHDPDCSVLVLRDYQTNNDVGQFREVYGGLKMSGGR